MYDGLGISIYDSDGQIRSLFDILADLNKVWPTLTTNEKDYIALTQAGANQTQNFVALMNNFDTALAATETALNSMGSATKENAAYMESLEAQTQLLTATFQDLANNVIDNELVSSLLTLANDVLESLNNKTGASIIQWGLLTGVLTGGITIFGTIISKLLNFSKAMATLSTAMAAGTVTLGTFASVAFPIAAIVAGIAVAVYGLKKAWDDAHPSAEELQGQVNDLNTKLETNKTRLNEINQIPYEDRTVEINKEKEALEKENAELKKNLEYKQEELANNWENEEIKVAAPKSYGALVSGIKTTDLETGVATEINIVADSIEELNKKIEEASKDLVAVTVTTGKAFKTMTNKEAWKSAIDAINDYKETAVESRYATEDQTKAYEEGVKQAIAFAKQIDDLGINTNDLSSDVLELYNYSKNLVEVFKEEQTESHKTATEMLGLNNALDTTSTNVSNTISLLEELEGSYNAISTAQKDMASSGTLSAKSIKALTELGLDKYLEQTADGYKLTKGALDDFVASQKVEYDVALNEARTSAINVIQNESDKATAYNATTTEIKKQLEAQIALYGSLARSIARTAPNSSMYGQAYWLEQNEEYQKALSIYEESKKALNDLAKAESNVANFGSVIGTLKTSSGSGSSKGAGDTKEEPSPDPVETLYKGYQEKNKGLEHNLFLAEKEKKSEQELIKLYKEHQAEIALQAQDLRKLGLDDDSDIIREYQKKWWDIQNTIEGYEDDITQKLQDDFDERLAVSEKYISERNELDDWGSDNEVAAWKRVESWMDEWYAQGLIDYEYYLDKRQDATKKVAEAEKRAWETANKAAIDSLSKEKNAWETTFSVVADRAQDEIDDLQKQRKEIEDYWDDQIKDLQEVNDLLDEQIARQELLDNLARAKQKKVMVFKDGKFQYIQDTDAVSEAQTNLDKFDRDAALQKEADNLQKSKEEALKAIDEQIKGWEEYRDKWANVVEDYQKSQDKLIAEQVLGTNLEGENWRDRLDKLSNYVEEYKSLMESLADAQNAKYGQTTPTGQPNADRLADINAEMAANSAKWHTASESERKQLEQRNKELAAEKDSIQGTSSKLNPDTGKWETSGGSSSSGGGSSGGGGKVGTKDSQGHTITGTDGTWGKNNPNAPSTNTNTGKGAIGKNPAIYGRASGTLSDEGGIRLLGEEGPEIGVLSKGDGVLPAAITRNLWQWGETTPSEVINSLQGMGTASQGQSQTIIVENLNLPQVQDGPGFVEYMKNHAMSSAIQFSHTR